MILTLCCEDLALAAQRIDQQISMVVNTIEDGIARAESYFHKVALNALAAQVAIGNTVYSVTVDGKPVPSKEYVHSAKKSVKFHFPLHAIELAIRIMRAAMQAEIAARALDTGKMKSSVRAWYGGNGKAPVEVTNVAEIDSFEQGDYVMLVPDIYYFAFSNSVVKDNTGKGFMARTAMRIRRALRITKKTAGLTVTVGRSLAVASHMNIPENRTGRRRVRKTPARKFPGTAIAGVPVVYIRWKSNPMRIAT